MEVWVIIREKGKVNETEDKNTKKFFIFSIIIGIISGNYLINFDILNFSGNSSLHYLIGAIVVWIGFTFRFWAILTLGKFFRTTVMIQKDHWVVKNGPYRLLRHPAYTGTMIALLGVSIGMGNWLSLIAVMGIPFIGINKRITVEEKTLSESLGNEYIDYKKKTKKLIPFIY